MSVARLERRRRWALAVQETAQRRDARREAVRQRRAAQAAELWMALERSGWNVVAAAQILGITRWVVYARMRQLRLKRGS